MINIRAINWNDAWKEERAQRGFSLRDSAFWDKRAQSFAENSLKTKYADTFLNIVNPEKEWNVFDMACGPGTLAVPLAGYVRSVTAVDFSGVMLEKVQERCIQAGISNIRTLKASWQDDWGKAGIGKHDVAIASRSLAVDNLKHAVMKLNNIAQKRVYISTIAGAGPHDRRIFEAIGRELRVGTDYYIYIYNLIYQMGIYANVSFIVDDSRKTYGSRAEALESMRWILGDMTHEEEEKLEDYFDRHLLYNAGRWVMDYRRTIRWAVLWWDKTTNIK